jgi:hypothetical protein
MRWGHFAIVSGRKLKTKEVIINYAQAKYTLGFRRLQPMLSTAAGGIMTKRFAEREIYKRQAHN